MLVRLAGGRDKDAPLFTRDERPVRYRTAWAESNCGHQAAPAKAERVRFTTGGGQRYREWLRKALARIRLELT